MTALSHRLTHTSLTGKKTSTSTVYIRSMIVENAPSLPFVLQFRCISRLRIHCLQNPQEASRQLHYAVQLKPFCQNPGLSAVSQHSTLSGHLFAALQGKNGAATAFATSLTVLLLVVQQ